MNAKPIWMSLIAVSIATVSTGVLAHEEYATEFGPYHWIQHLNEAKVAPKGVAGPVRSDVDPSSASRAAGTTLTSQPVVPPFRALGGIGGEDTN